MRHCKTWAVVFAIVLGSRLALAAEAIPTATAKPQAAESGIELFKAMADGQVAVTLVPRDATKVTLQITNKTKEPLSVNLPAAFAAMPVLAQFQPGGLQPGGLFGQQNNNAQPQVLGAPFQRGNGNNIGNGPNAFPNFNFNRPLMPFNIPPEKTIVVRTPAVCLEYGKPDPQPRMAYEIRPLESFTDNAAVAELLAYFGAGQCTQREAQLAAWHLANSMSWDELSKLQIEHLNGRKELRFSAAEVERAKKIVVQLPATKGGDKKTSLASQSSE